MIGFGDIVHIVAMNLTERKPRREESILRGGKTKTGTEPAERGANMTATERLSIECRDELAMVTVSAFETNNDGFVAIVEFGRSNSQLKSLVAMRIASLTNLPDDVHITARWHDANEVELTGEGLAYLDRLDRVAIAQAAVNAVCELAEHVKESVQIAHHANRRL